MTIPISDPSSARLRRDLGSAIVEEGIDAGFWRIWKFEAPILTVSITAGDGRELGMRVQVDHYPTLAPAGQPWDLIANQPLPPHRWPTGITAAAIFRRDWSVGNGNAPYMACERLALQSHPNWITDPRAWHPGRTIAFYLQELHHELRAATMPDVGGLAA